MPDQAVIDGSMKTGPALSATSDLPNLIPTPDPVATPAQPPAPAPASGTPPPAETAAEPAPGAGTSPDGTGASPGTTEQPQLPLESPPEPSPIRARMADLARDRREAQAEARLANERTDKVLEANRQSLEANRALQEQLKEVLARLPAVQPNGPVGPPPEIPRPRRSEYVDPDAWDEALADWVRQDTLQAARAEATRIAQEHEQRRVEAERQSREQAAQQAATQQQNNIAAAFQRRYAEYTKEHPDFDFNELTERESRGEFPISPTMVAVITESEIGPAVLHYLGQNPTEVTRIAALSPTRQVAEIGKIEDRVTAPPPPPPVPPAPRAPSPPSNRVGSSAAAAQESMYDIGSQPGRTDEYAKMRMPQLQAERKAQMFGIRQP